MAKPKNTKKRLPKKAKASELPSSADRQVSHLFHLQGRAAPLPTPSEFRGYEEVVKGAAERIIRMAEERQEHIIYLDQRKQTDFYKHLRRG